MYFESNIFFKCFGMLTSLLNTLVAIYMYIHVLWTHERILLPQIINSVCLSMYKGKSQWEHIYL